MTQLEIKSSKFKEKLRCPAGVPGTDDSWAFIILPKKVSEKLPRRGRTTIEGNINGCSFQATLEPDGKLSHWFKVNKELLKLAGAEIGDKVSLEIKPVKQEPEPDIPAALKEALAAVPKAQAVWNDTTTIARLDWIHWIVSAKKSQTQLERISKACDMLASGKRRVCCFDPSGYYSKALSAPEETVD